MLSSSVIDSSSSTTSTRTGLPSGLSSSVRPWGEVVVMVHTLSGPSEKRLSSICELPEKHTGESQAAHRIRVRAPASEQPLLRVVELPHRKGESTGTGGGRRHQLPPAHQTRV